MVLHIVSLGTVVSVLYESTEVHVDLRLLHLSVSSVEDLPLFLRWQSK